MKVGIHHNKQDDRSFSKRWIEYCQQNDIDYKIVNAYDYNIVLQLSDCDVFMWHYFQTDYRDMLFAKQLLYSLQISGKKVFPDFHTCWHFDDKVGQKYLLEAIHAQFVPSYVFYKKKDAIDWIYSTSFPKVFKLRGGAASANVKLARSQEEANRFVNKAFGRGYSQFDKIENLKERIRKFNAGKDSLTGLLKGVGRLFIKTEFAKMFAREKGYVYFQDFIPNNKFDIRIVVVDEKAFAIKRMCRKNDFRASGGGFLVYNREEIDERCVSLALDINLRLKSQCTSYDFVFDENNNPLIVEISFGFMPKAYDLCEGYWDKDMNWLGGRFNPYGWMIEEVIRSTN